MSRMPQCFCNYLLLLFLVIGVIIPAVVSAVVPGFVKNSYINILKGASIDLVMACGMMCVLLIGSIDISVAGVLAFAGSLTGMMMREGYITSIPMMFVVAILVGSVFGAVSGILPV